MSKNTTVLFLASLTLAALLAASLHARPQSKIAYPEGYRSWTHVKSMWLSTEHGLADPFAGLHHVYANEAATKALKKRTAFPDGATIVFDLLAAQPKDHAIAEDGRKLLGVMHKDARRYPRTGGWGFEAFAGDSRQTRIVKDGGVSCFACHQGRKANDFVFSEWRK